MWKQNELKGKQDFFSNSLRNATGLDPHTSSLALGSEYQPSQGNELRRVSETPWAVPAAANMDTGFSFIHSFPGVSETPTMWLAWSHHSSTRKALITSLKEAFHLILHHSLEVALRTGPDGL